MSDRGPSFLDKYMMTAAPALSEPPPDGPERECLPTPDAEYKPFGRRSNADEYAIHFIAPGLPIRSLQYQHLDDGFFSPDCIVLTFMGIVPKRVTILGRGFRQADYEQIHQRRTPWVRVAARDIGGDGETIVTGVEIEVIKEEEEGQSREEGAAAIQEPMKT